MWKLGRDHRHQLNFGLHRDAFVYFPEEAELN